jgi:hypothetical protein
VLQVLDEQHEVIGAELTLGTNQLWFVLRVSPIHTATTMTLLETYRRLDDGAIEFPADTDEAPNFRAAWRGGEFVLGATTPRNGDEPSAADFLPGNHTWHFVLEESDVPGSPPSVRGP